jgi:hypothetical protein
VIDGKARILVRHPDSSLADSRLMGCDEITHNAGNPVKRLLIRGDRALASSHEEKWRYFNILPGLFKAPNLLPRRRD